MRNTRIYSEWIGMKSRCKPYNHPSNLKNYYLRGIVICDEWVDKENGFMNYYKWAMANGYRDDLTIDRINNDGNYEPTNCRWIIMSEQFKNMQSSIYVIFNNENWYLLDLLKQLKRLDEYPKLKSRIKRGWTIEETLNIPFNMKKHYYYFLTHLLNEFKDKEIGYKITKVDFVKKYYGKYTKIGTYMTNKYIIEAAKKNNIKNNKFNFIKI